LPSLEQESDPHLSLSPGLAPKFISHKDIADDVFINADLPAHFNNSCEFEVGEQFDNAGELDMSITRDVEHHDIDESEAIYLQESHEEKVKPVDLALDDAILSVEYEHFSCGLISMKVLTGVFKLHMNHSLLIPSLLMSSLNLTSQNLLSLGILSLRILIWPRLLRILNLNDLWTLDLLLCLGYSFMMIKFLCQ